jgi:hypothetical protein
LDEPTLPVGRHLLPTVLDRLFEHGAIEVMAVLREGAADGDAGDADPNKQPSHGRVS